MKMKKQTGGSAVLKMRREVSANRVQGPSSNMDVDEFWQKHFGAACPYQSPVAGTATIEEQLPKRVGAQRRAMDRLMEHRQRKPRQEEEDEFPPGYSYRPRSAHASSGRSTRERTKNMPKNSKSLDEEAFRKEKAAATLKEAQAVMEIQASMVQVMGMVGERTVRDSDGSPITPALSCVPPSPAPSGSPALRGEGGIRMKTSTRGTSSSVSGGRSSGNRRGSSLPKARPTSAPAAGRRKKPKPADKSKSKPVNVSRAIRGMKAAAAKGTLTKVEMQKLEEIEHGAVYGSIGEKQRPKKGDGWTDEKGTFHYYIGKKPKVDLVDEMDEFDPVFERYRDFLPGWFSPSSLIARSQITYESHLRTVNYLSQDSPLAGNWPSGYAKPEAFGQDVEHRPEWHVETNPHDFPLSKDLVVKKGLVKRDAQGRVIEVPRPRSASPSSTSAHKQQQLLPDQSRLPFSFDPAAKQLSRLKAGDGSNTLNLANSESVETKDETNDISAEPKHKHKYDAGRSEKKFVAPSVADAAISDIQASLNIAIAVGTTSDPYEEYQGMRGVLGERPTAPVSSGGRAGANAAGTPKSQSHGNFNHDDDASETSQERRYRTSWAARKQEERIRRALEDGKGGVLGEDVHRELPSSPSSLSAAMAGSSGSDSRGKLFSPISKRGVRQQQQLKDQQQATPAAGSFVPVRSPAVVGMGGIIFDPMHVAVQMSAPSEALNDCERAFDYELDMDLVAGPQVFSTDKKRGGSLGLRQVSSKGEDEGHVGKSGMLSTDVSSQPLYALHGSKDADVGGGDNNTRPKPPVNVAALKVAIADNDNDSRRERVHAEEEV